MPEKPGVPEGADASTERQLSVEPVARHLYRTLSERLLSEATVRDDWMKLELQGNQGRYSIGDQPSKTWLVPESIHGRKITSIPGLEHVAERPHTADIPEVMAALRAMRMVDPDRPIPLGVQIDILQSPDPSRVPERSISLDVDPFGETNEVEVSSYMSEAQTLAALEAIAADLGL